MLETIPLIALSSNPTGSLREGKRVMERMWRGRWRGRWRSRRRQLGGGRGTPRVSSPSYPSDGQGRLLPSKHTHPSLLRKEDEEKKSLPLNDVGCVSYLTVGWISSTMWKAFRVLSSASLLMIANLLLLPRSASFPLTCLRSLVQTMLQGTRRGSKGSGRRRSRDARTILKNLHSAGPFLPKILYFQALQGRCP